ncbi:hypothetical protein EBN03_01525 [Nocardia stercoris]|uniref:Uncharacterized protein n=1 Tax=Nocardia stercoris TaxID=2483361 RepID=A0A3M2LC06_9NOCA|nr:hypothetical protein EBN03_01525 [Nocardia stercoris]
MHGVEPVLTVQHSEVTAVGKCAAVDMPERPPGHNLVLGTAMRVLAAQHMQVALERVADEGTRLFLRNSRFAGSTAGAEFDGSSGRVVAHVEPGDHAHYLVDLVDGRSTLKGARPRGTE